MSEKPLSLAKDDARWFKDIGRCISCSKPANGEVMGSLNQSLGAYCLRCGAKRIVKARKERGEK